MASAVLALSGVAVAVAGCEGRAAHDAATSARASTSPSGRVGPAVTEIDLSRGAPEEVQPPLFGPPARRSFIDLVRALRAANDGSNTKALFVRLGASASSLARAQEIGALLGEARARGLPVVCHADEYDNSTLLVAAKGCSRVWLSPAGQVGAVGIAAQLLYANSLLERLHVRVDFLQVGKYKGAEETFTRDGPSPEARASLEGALRALRAAWLEDIAQGRGKPELAEVIEDGPFTPEEAKQKGLVDELGYADEAREDAKKAAGVEKVVTRFGAREEANEVSRSLVEILRALSGSEGGGSPHVAVVTAVGSISMGASQQLPFGGDGGITERDLGRELSRLTTDESTKAVVIRIDSPGGSALASDLLWRKLMALREKKPVVFSIGGMAASGGYYLACTGNKIVAEPTSIIGSIGVVGGKLAFGTALEEIGVHAETVAAAPDPKKAARAAYMSPFTGWDDATREKVRASMQSIYDLFLKRVAEGRGTEVDRIAPSAEGRIFGGVEAKERGLVDTIGGFGDALALAKELAKLPEDTPFEVVGESQGLIDLLDKDASASGKEGAASRAVEQGVRRAAREAILPAWTDALPEVGTFVGSMAPLLQGERALATVPFGLVIR